ncbi:hypothetical protein WJ96_07075 [Burkholderia ubonensis]|uniref:Uncharacterized protein n=1 Tax=Burkholderia ubonensis TaxID=101571 RepID=A0AAW3N2Q5_9BURK|nr:hypothetical protein [Burkholderia ubonensis]KVP75463.1 hypothetical protein WJ93_08870 [Burkholderia ubonensis]KVP96926.1 hypothetical protein WJ97_13980 [Burkholderia ubonensis]KVP98276.1 hypothetical protein WJ96_07075 [Burkholderia ubonensis]KVZ92974.1 hypothetical protein WL25_18735 [Burkholderia ubonensis]
MKILLLIADDGISGQVWLHMAKRYLSEGRTVLAITDDLNVYEAIGTGDGLPGYDQGLTGHPNFRTTTVGMGDAGRLVRELESLEASTVVMFNMSPLAFLRHNPEWQAVAAFCAQSEHELVMSQYHHSQWPYDLERLMEMAGQEVTALADIPWDYVAGHRVVSHQNIEALRRLFPSLAGQISPLSGFGAARPEGTTTWQIITREGSFELRLAIDALIHENLDAYPALWDVHHDLESVASTPTPVPKGPPPQQETSLIRKIALAVYRLF